ncbi:MAG: prepilin-type N-terminal cleavage/methylation domain-containing protein [Sedimentisphaerales bacterium]|nr:prepilin-type N-terminal cleavage/methylation domain-containing protein [Sedimentisphaerales bacterium]
MLNLTYPQTMLDCSYIKNNYGYKFRDRITGFTLVELLIVVVIISIAALTAIPMMSSAASMQIRSAANILTADLEYAKSMAISRAQNYSVVFDASADSYRIEDQNGNVLQHPVKKGFDYEIDFQNDGRLNKVDIVSVDFDSTSKVTFDYLGSPYNGNVTPGPLNSGVINLQAGSTNTIITVEPVTGYVSIQ